jgi:hypothetical protein
MIIASPWSHLFLIHPSLELVDAAAGIHQFLPAGKERMTFRANVDIQMGLDRPGFKGFTTVLPNLGWISFFTTFTSRWMRRVSSAICSDTYAAPDSDTADSILLQNQQKVNAIRAALPLQLKGCDKTEDLFILNRIGPVFFRTIPVRMG